MCRRVKLLSRRFAPFNPEEVQLYYSAPTYREKTFSAIHSPKKEEKEPAGARWKTEATFCTRNKKLMALLEVPLCAPNIKGDCSVVLHRRSPPYQTTAAPPPFILHFFSLFCGVVREIRRGVVGAIENDQARRSKMMTFGGGQKW